MQTDSVKNYNENRPVATTRRKFPWIDNENVVYSNIKKFVKNKNKGLQSIRIGLWIFGDDQLECMLEIRRLIGPPRLHASNFDRWH